MENWVPRKPGKAPNDKRMNKRGEPLKARAKPLQLHPAVPTDKYNSQKADQGKHSKDTLVKPVALDENSKSVQPRSVPKYSADTKQNIDGEDFSLHVTSGKVIAPTRPTTELHHEHGRMPDEFHNTEFEQNNPHLIQPVHYDHYEPRVEGFFGAGYNFEPMEREHFFVHETAAFTPGHFTPGEYEQFEGMHA